MKMEDMTPQQITEALAAEGMQLNLEAAAAAMITLNAGMALLLERAGLTTADIKLTEEEDKRRGELVRSMATRLMNVATLAAASAGQELDQKKLADNVIRMLTTASETKGESIQGENAIGEQLMEGMMEPEPVTPSTGDAGETGIVGHVEDTDTHTNIFVDEPDDTTVEEDTDLLALFRSARAQKAKSEGVTFEGDKIRALFYNPETLPESPEEFADYDRRAMEYFKNMVDKAVKAGAMPQKLAHQVIVVLAGGVNFQMDDVVNEDGHITKEILEQGQDKAGFEVKTKSPRDVSEAIIAAYSVSIARLRGAYMQAQLGLLQQYMEGIDQTGPKI
jgi:hypothetical protein